jgi:cell division protein FtsZ
MSEYLTKIIDEYLRIKVVGVGGAGINLVNHMMRSWRGGDILEFIVADTDRRALERSAARGILLGEEVVKGRGAGGDLEAGREAAVLSAEAITAALAGAEVVFVVAGLGGGTGTGAAPFVAGVAAGLKALTVAVVTTPFAFERHQQKDRKALAGLAELRLAADSVFAVSNEQLLTMSGKQLTIATTAAGTPTLRELFKFANDALANVVEIVSEALSSPAHFDASLDDVRSALAAAGVGAVGFGRAAGEGRASEAARHAIASPLLNGAATEKSRSVIVNLVTGGALQADDLFGIHSTIRKAVGARTTIIFGWTEDASAQDEARVWLLFTGLEPPPGSAVRNMRVGTSRRRAEVGQPADFLVVWDPETVERADYVSLITALGDLVRSEGGVGVERIGRLGVGVRVGEDMLV